MASSVGRISSISIFAGLFLVSLTLLSQVEETSTASLGHGPNSDIKRSDGDNVDEDELLLWSNQKPWDVVQGTLENMDQGNDDVWYGKWDDRKGNGDDIQWHDPIEKREVMEGRINPAYLGEWTKINSRTTGAVAIKMAYGLRRDAPSVADHKYIISNTDDGADGITYCWAFDWESPMSSAKDRRCTTLIPGQMKHDTDGAEMTLSIDRHGIPKTVFYYPKRHLSLIVTGKLLPNGDLAMMKSIGNVVLTEYFKKTQS